MKSIFDFILSIILAQVVIDNLPNLHRKNLLRYLGNLLKPLEPFVIILLGLIAIKLAKTQDQKMILSILLIATIALWEHSKREGKMKKLIEA